MKVEDETGGVACVITVEELIKNELKYNVYCDILPFLFTPDF